MERRFIAMTGRKTKAKKKRKFKNVDYAEKTKVVVQRTAKEAGHTPEATAANKKALLVALSLGMNPGDGAEAVGVGRSTVFNWKKEDPEFAAAWEEARETSFDRAETMMYTLGMNGDVAALKETLRANRPERWRETRNSESTSTTNLNVRMTLEESEERVRQLGIVLPAYEGDQIEDHTIPLIEGHVTDRGEDDPSRN